MYLGCVGMSDPRTFRKRCEPKSADRITEARIPVWTPQDSRSWNLAEGEGLEMRNGALSAGIPRHHSVHRPNFMRLTGLVK